MTWVKDLRDHEPARRGTELSPRGPMRWGSSSLPARAELSWRTAAELSRNAERSEKIGVFVNETPARVAEMAQKVGLYRRAVARRRTGGADAGIPASAGRAEDHQDVAGARVLSAGEERLAEYLSARDSIDALLLDSGSAQQRGGTGVPSTWEEVAPVARRFGKPCH